MDRIPLIGRDAELARLRAFIATIPRHGCGLALVGDPGIGKSALIAATIKVAHDAGYRILKASGVESEALLPYAALDQLLRPVMDQVGNLPERQRGVLLGALDAAAREIKAQVGAEAWSKLVTVVTTAHQARAREVSIQYFERALGEHLTEGALGEQRLVVLEGAAQKAMPESVMTAHLVDQRLSSLLFDDPLFLQSDVLGKYAGPHLDRLFARAAP